MLTRTIRILKKTSLARLLKGRRVCRLPGCPRGLERGLHCRGCGARLGGAPRGLGSSARAPPDVLPLHAVAGAPASGLMELGSGKRAGLGQACPDQAHLVSEAIRARRGFSQVLVLGPGLGLWVQVVSAGTGRQGGSPGAEAGQGGRGPGCLEGRFC